MPAAVLARGIVATLLVAAGGWAETTAGLVARVRDGLTAHRSDAELAAAVRQIKLTERLSDAAVEALESDGAGPLALAELDRQRELSESLPASSWSLPDAPPPLSPEDRTRLIEEAREIAIRYTAGLPNFLCTETVHRYAGKSGKLQDTLVLAVSFNGKKDRYRLLTVNGKPTMKVLETVGGYYSNGDFGTAQRMVFDPESQAQFTWVRWTRLHGRPAQVFTYHVDAKHSQFALDFEAFQKGARMIAGVYGLVYLDAETHNVMRIRIETEGIPAHFPVTRTFSVIDYGFADIGGTQYLLPRSSDLRLYTKKGENRNLMEFTNYRRFTGEATISFDKQ